MDVDIMNGVNIPEVSVVTAVYNGGEFLRASIGSILEQKDVGLEFIIVDDGSSDGSTEVLRELAQGDERIRLIEQENTGLTLALIRGCSEARAKFIARHDADDFSHPERLRRQLALINSEDSLVMVSCWADYIGPDGEPLDKVKRSGTPREVTIRLVSENEGPPAHGTMLFRRSAYEAVAGYRSQFYFAQDSDLWLRLVDHGDIGYVEKSLYDYRLWPGSISVGKRASQQEFGKIGRACHRARFDGQDETELLDQAEKLTNQVRDDRAHKSSKPGSSADGYYFLGSLLEQQKHPSARGYLMQAIRRNPLHVAAWCKWLRCR